ncbi:MAG TPA: CDP-diacylglycerol--serine O-phosphatidyltransferase [Planctomycetota bacterium]|jgi:CDP-diacylglycerol--serine O-phosphatidyltransferase|nr:CDP-diacylglycerol--serine O-phosphatidyltransferase [Planctomycetota bacterium]
MKSRGILPGLLTLGNAFCGFLAIAKTADALLYAYGPSSSPGGEASLEKMLVEASWLVLLAMLFDALDGKVARLMGSTSELGGQLDSLADAISFGVAPALLVKVLVEHEVRTAGLQPHPRLYFLVAGFYALCALLRLARFNVENDPSPEAHERFTGLPSPAAAGVAVSLVLLYFFDGTKRVPWIDFDAVHVALRRVFPFTLPVLGVLMISRVRYTHFLSWVLRERKVFPFLAVVLVTVLLLLYEPQIALALGFLGYALSGPVGAVVLRALPAAARTQASPPSRF